MPDRSGAEDRKGQRIFFFFLETEQDKPGADRLPDETTWGTTEMKWRKNRIEEEKRKDLSGIFSFFYAFYGIITII